MCVCAHVKQIQSLWVAAFGNDWLKLAGSSEGWTQGTSGPIITRVLNEYNQIGYPPGHHDQGGTYYQNGTDDYQYDVDDSAARHAFFTVLTATEEAARDKGNVREEKDDQEHRQLPASEVATFNVEIGCSDVREKEGKEKGDELGFPVVIAGQGPGVVDPTRCLVHTDPILELETGPADARAALTGYQVARHRSVLQSCREAVLLVRTSIRLSYIPHSRFSTGNTLVRSSDADEYWKQQNGK